MNYDRIILELMDRVSKLEEEIATLKSQCSAPPSATGESIRLGRDVTKYILDGVKYGKSRLVLAIVRKYYKEHPGITAEELTATFDRSLQGSLGVIRPLQDAQSYSLYNRRFFCGDDEVITMNGTDYVVCSQWSSANINNMIARAKELGIHVTII